MDVRHIREELRTTRTTPTMYMDGEKGMAVQCREGIYRGVKIQITSERQTRNHDFETTYFVGNNEYDSIDALAEGLATMELGELEVYEGE